MEEKIIIDGVNVAGCEYYKGKCMGYTHYCKIGCKECTDIGIKLCPYKKIEIFKANILRLEKENARLKEEIEIRDNLSEKFRKEALSWANIANEYQKDKTKLEHALEEIRYIANQTIIDYTEIAKNNEKLKALDLRNRMSEIQNIINEAGE